MHDYWTAYWAWIAAIIGPLTLPLVFLFPILHGKNGV
jgi:hypothetical protein